MAQQDYEKARQQCWNAAALNNRLDDSEENKERFFDFIFDNAYALGKEEAMKQQWTSVDDAHPQEYRTVLAYIPSDGIRNSKFALAYWDGEDWYDDIDHHIRPDYWMYIPPLTK